MNFQKYFSSSSVSNNVELIALENNAKEFISFSLFVKKLFHDLGPQKEIQNFEPLRKKFLRLNSFFENFIGYL